MTAYRNDLDAAHYRIDSLEHDKRTLREELRQKPKVSKKKVKKVKCKQCGGRFYRMGRVLFGIVSALILFGGLAVFVYIVVTERGTRECYIESEGLIFKLKRTVDWGEDRVIGSYRSMNEAIADSQKINCGVE